MARWMICNTGASSAQWLANRLRSGIGKDSRYWRTGPSRRCADTFARGARNRGCGWNVLLRRASQGHASLDSSSPYCGLMPAALMIPPQRAVSDLWKAANVAGVPPAVVM